MPKKELEKEEKQTVVHKPFSLLEIGYVESERLSYIVSSAMKLNDIFYNVYTDSNEVLYTVTSNGIIMKTDC